MWHDLFDHAVFSIDTTDFFPANYLGYIILLLSYACVSFFVLKLKKWNFITGIFFLFIEALATDYFTQSYAFMFVPREQFMMFYPEVNLWLIKLEYYPLVAACTLSATLSVLILVWVLRRVIIWICNIPKRYNLQMIRIILLSCMSLGLCVFFLAEMDRRNLHNMELWPILEQSIAIMLLAITAFYVIIELNSLHLSRQNKTLQQQQKIYDELLQELRLFRHNFSNMLYGFEGPILTRDMDVLQEYYEQMVKKCTRINNENAVMLNRINNVVVRALLLNKIQIAQAKEIPFYLEIEKDLCWHGLKDSDMCEVLGALIDNAIEATEQAATPRIIVSISIYEHSMEVVVGNTYAADADLSFLTDIYSSSKFGHEGIGLSGVRSILSRYGRSVIMNQIQRGRYIESILLFD